MNSLYQSYIPAINAYLNAIEDTSCKSWENVVNVFFTLNKDPKMASKAHFAEIFDSANHPNYFRVQANRIDQYFDTFKITSKALLEDGFEKDVDFVEDSEGLRLSFSSVRKIIFQKGDSPLIEMFDLIDKIYQTFVRYELAMMNRSRRLTHWTIFQQTSKFTKAMQPHVDFIHESKGSDPTFRIMDTQPEVYCIVKGTLKSINTRIAKYEKEYEAYRKTKADPPKCSPVPVTPIFESVLSNIDDEINAFLGFVNESRVKPYRKAQVGKLGLDGRMVDTISSTKYNVKTSKTCILISSDQNEYEQSMLSEDAKYVRTLLKYGNTTHIRKASEKKYSKEFPIVKKSGKKEKTDLDNVVDIEIFNKSEGTHIDTFKLIKLVIRSDGNVSEVGSAPSSLPSIQLSSEADEEVDEEEAEEEDEEEAEVEEEEEKPKKKSKSRAAVKEEVVDEEVKPKKTVKKSKSRTVVKEEVDEEMKSEEEVKPKKSPKQSPKSKSNAIVKEEVDDEETETDEEVKPKKKMPKSKSRTLVKEDEEETETDEEVKPKKSLKKSRDVDDDAKPKKLLKKTAKSKSRTLVKEEYDTDDE